jgi:hypothetical protein
MKVIKRNEKNENFVEGVDFYYENGLVVLTAHFLLKRGQCCGNDCRHCPYSKAQIPAAKSQ